MNIFRSKTSKINSSNIILDDSVKVFFSKERYNGCTITIDPESTCNDILANNWDEMSKPMTSNHKTEKCLFSVLSQDNKEFTYIILQPNSKPFYDIKTRGLELFYMPMSAYYPSRKQTERAKSLELPKPNTKKSKSKPIKLIEGTLLMYNHIKNSFFKQKAALTESCLSLIGTGPHINLSIDSNLKFNSKLVYAVDYIKEKLKDNSNLIEILFDKSVYIFKIKNKAEYDNWLNCFNIAIHSDEQGKREIEYNHLIEKHNQSIGMHSINRIEKCIDFQFFLSQQKYRRYMFSFFNNKKLSDIFENMILYKKSAYDLKCFESWGYLLQVCSYIEAFQANQMDEKQLKLPSFVTNEKFVQLKALKKDIDAILMKDGNYSSNEVTDDAKDKLRMIMSSDLFEEEYNNIVERILKPFYERKEMKEYLTKGIITVLFFDCIKINKFLYRTMFINLKNEIRMVKVQSKLNDNQNLIE